MGGGRDHVARGGGLPKEANTPGAPESHLRADTNESGGRPGRGALDGSYPTPPRAPLEKFRGGRGALGVLHPRDSPRLSLHLPRHPGCLDESNVGPLLGLRQRNDRDAPENREEVASLLNVGFLWGG